MFLAVTVTGLPAILIIIVVLALLGLGLVTLVRGGAKGVGKVVDKKGSKDARAGGV